MTKYEELLLDPRWIEKKEEILRRDRNVCTHCSNSTYTSNLKKSLARWHGSLDLLNNFPTKKNSLSYPSFWGKNNPTGFFIAYYIEDEEKLASLFALRKCYTQPKGIFGNQEWIETFYYQEMQHENDIDKLPWSHIYGLHVHHKYYQSGLLPWEYPNEALTTLCFICHEDLHENETIPVINEYGNKINQ
jgi:hypothetical protein